MLFESLTVNNVRNITDTQITPNKLLNVIVGPNASGKTAFLEAIHILARAKSFRTPRIKDVIQYDKQALQVIAEVKGDNDKSVLTGIEKRHGSTLIKYNSDPVKTVSEQARNIPLILINPDSHCLITGSPKQRRHWLDWAMFHVEPTYLKEWKSYQKALRNRNILLKKGGSNEQINGWESSMSVLARGIDDLRKNFINKLQKQFFLLKKDDFLVNSRFELDKGYSGTGDFKQCLVESRDQDRRLGYTKYGPHKADIKFFADDYFLAQLYSRGQIKRFVTLFLLAQAKTYEQVNREKPVFLIDDYAAELDAKARLELLKMITDYGGQTFLTSTDEDEGLSTQQEFQVFHVERGNFHKVVKYSG
jgi:DNA replication and repair protein RecF